MAYSKFNADPISKRLNAAFANLCSSSYERKDSLNLVNGAFTVFSGSSAGASFQDLQKFNFPVDTASSIQFEICAGETLSLFDNALDSIAASSPTDASANHPFGENGEYIAETPASSGDYFLLSADRNYVRGCLLYVYYPSIDKNGDTILPADYECEITLIDRELNETRLPVCQFFAHFANPETRGANGLINKLEIHNPRDNFSIKVNALLVYAKSDSNPNNCAC